MRNFGTHVTSLLSISICLVGCILYPFWLIDGYLDNWYLKIMVFVASYGGMVASSLCYYKFIKNNK